MNLKWLEEYLVEAIGKKLCTKIHCTTCGAMEFRKGVLSALSVATAKPLRQHFDRGSNIEIARALAEVRPNGDASSDLKAAVECLLVDLWSGMPLLDNDIEVLLDGTWPGELLRTMKEHHEAREAERRAREEFQDRANVQKRREEKKRLNQEKHEERLTLKKERDRLWREKLGKAD
jgi:hypothetical protein